MAWVGALLYNGPLALTAIRTAKWPESHHEHSQADVGMRRQHVDVVLTQWVDDDRFAPINQVSSNLKNLKGENIISK